MYIVSDDGQLTMEPFYLPFGGTLLKSNRWVKLAGILPWEQIERIYMSFFPNDYSRQAIPSRIAFGALFIKESEHLTDAGTVAAIQENPYMQYFLGLTEFHPEPLFHVSMMVHFRRRFPPEALAEINESIGKGILS